MKTLVLSIAAALVAASTMLAAENLSGEWVIHVQGHQIGLELEQKDTAVQGVMLAMGGRVLLTGTFAGETLTLEREAPEGGKEKPGSASDAPVISATLQKDGTLKGQLRVGHGGTLSFTAERFKKP